MPRSTPWDQYRVTESGLYLSDNTVANASTAAHGLAPKLDGNAAHFLNGAGGWSSPTGGSGGGGGTFDPSYTVGDGIRQSAWIPELRRMVVNGRNSGILRFIDPVLLTIQERTAHGASTDTLASMAYDPTNFQLFVTNYINNSGNLVHVIDLATFIRTTVTVGTGPLGIAWCPTNDCVYVVNVSGNSVSVISTASLSVVTTITVGTLPVGICYCPSNDRLYVGNRSSNSVSVINPSTNTVATTITSMAAADCPFYNPSNDTVIVLCSTSSTHKIINPSTNTATALTTNGFSNCRGGTYVPSTDELWIAANNNNRFEVYDASNNTAITTVTASGCGAPAYCPLTDRLYWRDESDGYWAFTDLTARTTAYMGF